MSQSQVCWILLFAAPLAAAEYHVSEKGNDSHDGSAGKPFRTISAAARIAQPGDTITVHAGTYRERVTPPRGGESDSRRIVYRAAPGETVWIKGSELARGWKPYRGDVWVLALPRSYFGAYNPYTDLIEGDWFNGRGRSHHTGDVYLNGRALFEAASFENVLQPKPFPEARDPEASLWTWFTTSDDSTTYIYANFHGKDPNRETVEINVRDSCFYPDQPGRNYITVRGFHLSHAATQWAAPTAEQIGLIGTHWSKGWVIENNTINDSKCSCVTLGKERGTGHNVWSRNPKKDGATHYNEVILRALAIGWSREKIGSHVVRNNTIFNCEQAGIAGSLGAIHSRISGNHIYNVWAKRQFTGAEMGGIKLHGAIDVLIEQNRIHNAGRGLWMDWMAQGTRISSNLLYDNTTDDLFVEVNHGPFVVDNNLFLSPLSLQDWSEGGAYAHNLFAGRIVTRPELNRWTPYHRPHSTALAGVTLTRGGDNRFFNNLFIGGDGQPSPSADPVKSGFGLWVYNARPFPSMAGGNVYTNGALPYDGETSPLQLPERAGMPEVVEQGDRVLLKLAFNPAMGKAATRLVTTELLGKTVVAEAGFDHWDGATLAVDQDYTGQPRNREAPRPGPFEGPLEGLAQIPVWPPAPRMDVSLGDGYRGIWYMNQPLKNQYRYKYSGGFGTYPQQHVPIAIYVPEQHRTFFVFGGSAGNVSETKDELLHLVSYYDHRTKTVPRPVILLNKRTEDAHDNPTLQIDSEGHLYVFSSAHGVSRPSYIYRSTRPYDIREWELIEKTNFSYPQPWYLPGSKRFLFLHTLYRSGERTLHFKSSPDARSWTEPRMLAHIEMGNYQVSWREEGSDRVATIFDLHPNHGRAGKGLNFRTNLYYAESADAGATWRTVDGRALDLPLTAAGNPALVHDFRADDLNVYMKDLAFDQAGRPVLLYLTSKGFEPGPESGPFGWHTARWTGSRWEMRPVAESDHNYDHGSLYLESDGTWRVIAPMDPGPQPWGTGGEVVMLFSRDLGQSWSRRALTAKSRYNHTYIRKPVNAHPEFYALWADGSALEPTPSSLYFCTKNGEVFRLPVTMTGDAASPLRVR